MPTFSVRLSTLHRKFPLAVLLPVLLFSGGVGGCANTAWGERIEQSLSIPNPIPNPGSTGETSNSTLQETPRPEVTTSPDRIPTDSSSTDRAITDRTPAPNGETTLSPSFSSSPNADLDNNTEEPENPSSTLGEAIGPTLPPSLTAPAGTTLNPTVPESLEAAVKPVLALGVLTVPTTPADVWEKPVSRRQFARWLFTVNNRLYADRPGQQIRATSTTVTPIFRDIPATDPDFTLIQGLAEAGILPSPLRGNATATQFRPDAPLTREQLVLWKVPLDARQSLPTATIDRIAQTWNFQDSAQISGEALGAVLLDFQNGELSNIRRVFGYTTLFQPQKAVTQGEAIVALGYFGFQGQGVSATNPPSP